MMTTETANTPTSNVIWQTQGYSESTLVKLRFFFFLNSIIEFHGLNDDYNFILLLLLFLTLAKQARAIAKGGQEFMESLSMNRIYDYMFHLINEYSKLQKFKPVRPSSSLEVCAESLLCLADPKQRKLLERSTAHPSPNPPCSLQPADSDLLKNWIQHRRKTIKDIEDMKLIPYKDIKSWKHFCRNSLLHDVFSLL